MKTTNLYNIAFQQVYITIDTKYEIIFNIGVQNECKKNCKKYYAFLDTHFFKIFNVKGNMCFQNHYNFKKKRIVFSNKLIL